MRANKLRPDLPLYPPGSQLKPLPTGLTALLQGPQLNGYANQHDSSDDEDENDEAEDGDRAPHTIRPPDSPPLDPDDPAVNYPKQGHGLARNLPPEQDDLEWMVDDNCEVYEHIHLTDQGAATKALFDGDAASGDAKEEEDAMIGASDKKEEDEE